jgi:hypothetical protein
VQSAADITPPHGTPWCVSTVVRARLVATRYKPIPRFPPLVSAMRELLTDPQLPHQAPPGGKLQLLFKRAACSSRACAYLAIRLRTSRARARHAAQRAHASDAVRDVLRPSICAAPGTARGQTTAFSDALSVRFRACAYLAIRPRTSRARSRHAGPCYRALRAAGALSFGSACAAPGTAQGQTTNFLDALTTFIKALCLSCHQPPDFSSALSPRSPAARCRCTPLLTPCVYSFSKGPGFVAVLSA